MYPQDEIEEEQGFTSLNDLKDVQDFGADSEDPFAGESLIVPDLFDYEEDEFREVRGWVNPNSTNARQGTLSFDDEN